MKMFRSIKYKVLTILWKQWGSRLCYIMNILIAIRVAGTAVCCDCIHCLNESCLSQVWFLVCLIWGTHALWTHFSRAWQRALPSSDGLKTLQVQAVSIQREQRERLSCPDLWCSYLKVLSHSLQRTQMHKMLMHTKRALSPFSFLYKALSSHDPGEDNVLDAGSLLEALRLYRWHISSFEEQVGCSQRKCSCIFYRNSSPKNGGIH